ncbi:hypothetical protein M2119_000374 [Aurantimicrobium minutum]|uniref:DUF6049 family protein n=1 Tax=Aurantimicrobium minutum TaxID=708131 RepID=UPI002475A122|nr:DUF6049 family protein [Aurantimicrobium minutum]MDH6532137.1 hypothetical protein [Aurantimicrobium minutum]
MLSAEIRRALTAPVVFLTTLLVIAGFLSVSSPVAHAADEVSVSLVPSTVSAGPNDALSVTITVNNKSTDDLPAGEAVVTAPSDVISQVSELDSWLAASDGTATPGRFLSTVEIPAVAAGKSVSVVQELPLSLGRFGAAWGPRGLAVNYEAEPASASARSIFVWTPTEAPGKTAFSGVMSIIAEPSASGLYTADELTTFTGPDGVLTRQLEMVRGHSVALGVDPRILVSLEVLGADAPASAKSWLADLAGLPVETFLLSYADADISAQAQAGATTLIAPDTSDVIQAEPVDPATTATPAPTETPAPAKDVLPRFDVQLTNLGWPAAHSVIGSDLPVFTNNGLTSLILSSNNLTSAGESPSSGTLAGSSVAVTTTGLSSALSRGDLPRAGAYAAAGLLDSSTSGRMFAELARDQTSLTALGKQKLTLTAFSALPWVGSGSLSTALSSASTGLSLSDSAESSTRITTIQGLLTRNQAVADFSTIAENPALITRPAARQLAAVLSVGWLGEKSWSEAVNENLRNTTALLNSVAVSTSSTVNMVGGQANIPISVRNALTQPVTVVVTADPSNGRLLVDGGETITIQPESQAKARIPVKAQVGNGSVSLTVTLSSTSGVVIGQPAVIPINVRADWETWGLAALGLAFAGLITAGVIRTVRRRRSEAASSAE